MGFLYRGNKASVFSYIEEIRPVPILLVGSLFQKGEGTRAKREGEGHFYNGGGFSPTHQSYPYSFSYKGFYLFSPTNRPTLSNVAKKGFYLHIRMSSFLFFLHRAMPQRGLILRSIYFLYRGILYIELYIKLVVFFYY